MFSSNNHAVLIFVESIPIINPIRSWNRAVLAEVFRNGTAMTFRKQSIQAVGRCLIFLLFLFFCTRFFICINYVIEILIAAVIAGVDEHLK